MMTKGLESVGGVDGLLDVPGIRETPAGLDRRIVTLEDGVLLSYGPRTPWSSTSSSTASIAREPVTRVPLPGARSSRPAYRHERAGVPDRLSGTD